LTAPEDARGPDPRPPWAALREDLQRSGFRPSRRLGQNFLLDENLLRAIVRDAAVRSGDHVLEVGPGLGFLTRHLLRAGARVLAVEIDPRLAERLATTLAGEPGWTLIVGDALAGKHALAPEVLRALASWGAWHLVSNLPYSSSAPLLAVCAALASPPATMAVLVQLELAERITAAPATADWGPLSIRLQGSYAARIVRRVPPDLFWPRPEVESALVRLERRPDAWSADLAAAVGALVEPLFQQRRKRILGVLSDLAGGRPAAEAWVARAGVAGGERAEDLPLAAWVALARERPLDPGAGAR
jgi:16S rRNA (adenine1518-N6/adenine1519-N6)-dimethyltransferase